LSLETDLNVETQEEHAMKISAIAAALHKAAADMEVFAAKNDNLDFPGSGRIALRNELPR